MINSILIEYLQVSEVAISLSGGMNILNKRVDAIDEGIIVAKDGLSVTQEQLEDTGSVLEDKLDAIDDAGIETVQIRSP